MEKISIKNRKGQKVVIVVDVAPEQKGLAFVMHGLGSSKNSPRITLIAQTFLEKGFTAVRFDTTNTFGESDGNYEDATITNYYEDLEDVIKWAKGLEWYQEPFVLAGSSLGGICTALYAEAHPGRVLALAPVAPVVSGALRVDARERKAPGDTERWKKAGIREEINKKRPGGIERLKWSHIEDSLKYDTLTEASKLTMPVLLIVGGDDTTTPPDQTQMLFDAIPGTKKEIHIIPGMEHGFQEPFFPEVKAIFSKWIDSIL